MRIKINAKQLAGKVKGDIIEVDDINGIPTEEFWRRRLRDSAIDDCCEVVKEIAKAKPRVAEAAFEPIEGDN